MPEVNVCPAIPEDRGGRRHRPMRIPSYRDRGGQPIEVVVSVMNTTDNPTSVSMCICRACGALFIPQESRAALEKQASGK